MRPPANVPCSCSYDSQWVRRDADHALSVFMDLKHGDAVNLQAELPLLRQWRAVLQRHVDLAEWLIRACGGEPVEW